MKEGGGFIPTTVVNTVLFAKFNDGHSTMRTRFVQTANTSAPGNSQTFDIEGNAEGHLSDMTKKMANCHE